MTSVTYAIIFNGDINEGFDLISVKAQLATLLRADKGKMKLLFSGKPIILKKTQDKTEAVKYGKALQRVGANVRVKILKDKVPLAAPHAKAPPTDFSLAPNEGRLFDPAPEVASLDIDLSSLSLGENDGSLLTEPKEIEARDIDLSEYSVAENDGGPLAEAAPEVEKVKAPDFGLDIPGAILETLRETVELLEPDTSGMSLAFPGSDLLNPDEKDQGPAPEAPDTSSITLAPNKASC
jgi:hypothetical protein